MQIYNAICGGKKRLRKSGKISAAELMNTALFSQVVLLNVPPAKKKKKTAVYCVASLMTPRLNTPAEPPEDSILGGRSA